MYRVIFMKKFLIAMAAAMVAMPALAEPAVKGWKTMDSMGCMMMRECTTGVKAITSVEDLRDRYPHSNFDPVATETDALIKELNKMGVGVFLSDDKYFPRGHAGVYYTVGNDFFMNESYADDPYQFLRTLRHEAWHAAQDAMAGSIDNNNIAIIYPEESVPQPYVLAAEIAYASQPGVLPWEKEAKWAGGTPNMTLDVLRIINETNDRPWDVIEPTPMTREWLVNQGYINE